jgi:hypothetical protein
MDGLVLDFDISYFCARQALTKLIAENMDSFENLTADERFNVIVLNLAGNSPFSFSLYRAVKTPSIV